MGVRGLPKELPGGRMTEQIKGFSSLDKRLKTQYGGRKVDLDTGTLVYNFALMTKVPFNAGDYLPAVKLFQNELTILSRVYDMDVTCIFDGRSPEEKSHEHRRRRERRNDDSVIINSTYIAMCAEVCRTQFFNYVVAPEEADMQVGRRNTSTVAMGRDGDLIAYGHDVVVMVDSYIKEEYRIIDMNTPVTEQTKDELPLYYYYKKYGTKIIHWWAAVMGCDVSKEECGIKKIGRKTFLLALQSFERKHQSALNDESFATALKNQMPITAKLPFIGITAKDIQNELTRVRDWFTRRGTYYDCDGNACSLRGRIIEEANRVTWQHMRGMLDPKTCNKFTSEQQRNIQSVQSHNMLHNSAVKREQLNGLSLPAGKNGVENCTIEQLKAMIIVRGGNVSTSCGKNMIKADMIRVVKAYLLAEKENQIHTVYFDRRQNNGGIFAKIQTGAKHSAQEIINKLLNCGEHEESIQQFFRDLLQYFGQNKFIDDFTTIAMQAPDLQEDFIEKTFLHVGDSKGQKSIRDGMKRVMEMQERIYHAMAFSEDRKSIYLLSKQQASQTHDEETRNTTAAGEKPLRAEYLVMMHIAIEPTTYQSHGHTLGRCTYVRRAYCGLCKAGCGMCHHKSACLWTQLLHWGEGRPTPKPPTSDFCQWIPGSNCKRDCSTVLPAANNTVQKLPKTSSEAKIRHESGKERTCHKGETARYDWHRNDPDILAALNSPEYMSSDRMKPLFDLIRNVPVLE